MSNSVPYRLFVAVPLPDETRQLLASWREQLSTKWSFQSWVHPGDYHITLQFLGNCTFRQMRDIRQALPLIAGRAESFRLTVSGIGIFGRPYQPRILWAGVSGDLKQLHELQKRVTEGLSPLGFPPEKRPYRPHITLARKCRDRDFPGDRLREWGPFDQEEASWTVREIVLYRSHLGRSPMYEPLEVYPLDGTGSE